MACQYLLRFVLHKGYLLIYLFDINLFGLNLGPLAVLLFAASLMAGLHKIQTINFPVVSLIALSLAFVNSQFCVLVDVALKCQQPISVIIKIVHCTIMLYYLTFQCDSFVNIIQV